MGQAKKRGSFEERKANAIKINEERVILNKKIMAQQERNMSPAERSKRNKSRMLLSAMIGISLSNL